MYLEPWSWLDSSLWRSKNLLLCSECQAKWLCCLRGLDGKGYWNRLGLQHRSIIAKNGRKATTSPKHSSGYSISILEKGNIFAISRASRLSSLSQVNDIALATRILWIMFIWPLSGLAHRSQITVLAYGKAWPVEGGKIEVNPFALLLWHGHWFGRVQTWSEQMEVPLVYQGANWSSPTYVGRPKNLCSSKNALDVSCVSMRCWAQL